LLFIFILNVLIIRNFSFKKESLQRKGEYITKEMKYVVVNDTQPILFSTSQKHSEFKHFNITSAGFCAIRYTNSQYEVSCYGESISLNLKPKDYDHKAIELMLNEY
jgi:hypothetical protein